jgi:hypothetical protein
MREKHIIGDFEGFFEGGQDLFDPQNKMVQSATEHDPYFERFHSKFAISAYRTRNFFFTQIQEGG